MFRKARKTAGHEVKRQRGLRFDSQVVLNCILSVDVVAWYKRNNVIKRCPGSVVKPAKHRLTLILNRLRNRKPKDEHTSDEGDEIFNEWFGADLM